MDLRLYVLLIPLTFNTYLRRNKNNEPSMAFRFYFLLIPLTFNSYLRKNIDYEPLMDPRASWSLAASRAASKPGSKPASQSASQPASLSILYEIHWKTIAKPWISAKSTILLRFFQFFPIISNVFQLLLRFFQFSNYFELWGGEGSGGWGGSP